MVVFKVGRNENKICMLYIVMKIRIPRDPQDRGPNRRTRHCLVGGRLLVTIFFLLLQDGLIIGKVFEVIRVDHLDGGAESAGELEGDRSLMEEVVDGVLVGFIVMIIMGCRVSDDGAHERIGFLGLPDLRPDGGTRDPEEGGGVDGHLGPVLLVGIELVADVLAKSHDARVGGEGVDVDDEEADGIPLVVEHGFTLVVPLDGLIIDVDVMDPVMPRLVVPFGEDGIIEEFLSICPILASGIYEMTDSKKFQYKKLK